MSRFRFQIIILLIILLGISRLYSGGRIWHDALKRIDTVDFGVHYPGQYKDHYFYIANDGPEKLMLGAVDPSFLIGRTPSHPYDFPEFQKQTSGIIELDPGDTVAIIIRYLAEPPPKLATYPPGNKEARLLMGLYDPVKYPDGVDDRSQLDTVREYIMVAKKTIQLLDTYRDAIDFDSVYVNPPNSFEKNWKIKNNADQSISISNIDYGIFTPVPDGEEFEFPEISVSAPIPSGQTIGGLVSYHPLNRGSDSAFGRIIYIAPESDTSDTAMTIFRGFGVQQEMRLFETDTKIDTLNFGDQDRICLNAGNVRVGTNVRIKGSLVNKGNIPFHALSQIVRNYYDNDISGAFSFISGFDLSGNDILTDEKTDFEIQFLPDSAGEFFARYIIGSDIKERNIWGIPAEASNVIVYIRGRGINPKISIPDTIDFGNIVVNPPYCSADRDTVIKILNTGNEELLINNLDITTGDFGFIPGNLSIPQYSAGSMTFTFSSGALGDSESKFRLFTNENAGFNVHEIILKARGVLPLESSISIPDTRSAPGRNISIPIITEGSKLGNARNFEDTVSFDPTSLQFLRTDPIGTASEGAIISADPDNSKGLLYLSMRIPSGGFFRNKDTLIKIQFRTYLGDRISYPVAFSEPRIGDDKCSHVINLNSDNGSFSIDSVCGLSLKVYTKDGGVFKFDMPSPNPADEYINLSFETAFKSRTRISIHNSYGEEVRSINNSVLPGGRYEWSVDLSGLPSGTYYCEMSAGIFRQQRIFVIKR